MAEQRKPFDRLSELEPILSNSDILNKVAKAIPVEAITSKEAQFLVEEIRNDG